MQQRYAQLFQKDHSLTIQKLRTATTKYFIRERQILEQMPPHQNIVKLIEVLNQPLKETVLVNERPCISQLSPIERPQ